MGCGGGGGGGGVGGWMGGDVSLNIQNGIFYETGRARGQKEGREGITVVDVKRELVLTVMCDS